MEDIRYIVKEIGYPEDHLGSHHCIGLAPGDDMIIGVSLFSTLLMLPIFLRFLSSSYLSYVSDISYFPTFFFLSLFSLASSTRKSLVFRPLASFLSTC